MIMMRGFRSALLAAVVLVVTACAGHSDGEQASVTATILPVKFLVEQIVGDGVKINLLVPPGFSPETYEPTPQQMKRLSSSSLLFSTGVMDFEQQLVADLSAEMKNVEIVDLSQGIELIADGHTHHGHGADPHIWTSPRNLRVMAQHIYEALKAVYPDSSAYDTRYATLTSSLDSLDLQIERIVAGAHHRTFLIYHPALAYLARDYGLTQETIERDGKELSAEQLKNIVDMARREGLEKVFYQRQFSQSSVSSIAREIGATTVEIDPLAENVVKNLYQITQEITE